MPVSKTFGAYVIITYLGFKETDFCWKNVVNNLMLKRCFFVTFYQERWFVHSVNITLSKPISNNFALGSWG